MNHRQPKTEALQMSQRDAVRESLEKLSDGNHGPAGSDDNAFMNRACDIIIAFLNKNSVAPADVPALITSVHATLSQLFGEAAQARPGPAAKSGAISVANIHDTVTPDYIICLEDGKRLQTLKRYIGGRFGLTSDQYRQKWNLPEDYPMVAPNYAKRRSRIAKQMGLGRKRPKKGRKRG
jgi:predicted transcriptional regulator